MKSPGIVKKFMAVAAIAAGLAFPAAETGAAPGDPYQQTTIPTGGMSPSYPAGHRLAPQSADDVDVRLVLVFDASGSMKPEEYAIQFEVARAALTSDDVLDAWFGSRRDSGAIDSIAIAVVDFGSSPGLRMPWVDFRRGDPNLDERFSAYGAELMKLVEQRNQGIGGSTQLGRMLQFVQQVFVVAPWGSEVRDVVDVFSDGTNDGIGMEGPRRELAAMGITINALAIVNERPDLDQYYRQNLVTQSGDGGNDRFVLPGRVWTVARNMAETNNSQEFMTAFRREVEIAFRQKIVWETANIEITPWLARTCVETSPIFNFPRVVDVGLSLR